METNVVVRMLLESLSIFSEISSNFLIITLMTVTIAHEVNLESFFQ